MVIGNYRRLKSPWMYSPGALAVFTLFWFAGGCLLVVVLGGLVDAVRPHQFSPDGLWRRLTATLLAYQPTVFIQVPFVVAVRLPVTHAFLLLLVCSFIATRLNPPCSKRLLFPLLSGVKMFLRHEGVPHPFPTRATFYRLNK